MNEKLDHVILGKGYSLVTEDNIIAENTLLDKVKVPVDIITFTKHIKPYAANMNIDCVVIYPKTVDDVGWNTKYMFTFENKDVYLTNIVYEYTDIEEFEEKEQDFIKYMMDLVF